MTNNFSIKRFAAYAQAEISSQKRTLLINLLVMVALILATYLLLNYLALFEEVNISQMNFKVAHKFILMIVAIFSISYISSAFRKFHKPLSASFAMLVPASKSEKFTFAFLFNFIAMPTLFSFIDYLFAFLFSGIYSLQDMGFYHYNEVVNSSLIGVAYLMFFFLGAVFFRRRPFINTSLTGLVLLVVLGMGGIAYDELVSGSFCSDFASLIEVPFWVITTLALAMCAWYRFKKLQIR